MKKIIFIILFCYSVVMQCSAGFNITERYVNCDKQEINCIDCTNSNTLHYLAIYKKQYDECNSLITKLLSMSQQNEKFNINMSNINITDIYLECNKEL
jgi:hypothetical protein